MSKWIVKTERGRAARYFEGWDRVGEIARWSDEQVDAARFRTRKAAREVCSHWKWATPRVIRLTTKPPTA